MPIAEFTLLVGLSAFAAGFLGALTGLGGGVLLVPLLTLGFQVDIRYAVGASLVSVIATSSGAAAAYLREGYTNLRLGMFLEMATTAGALVGAALVAVVAPRTIAGVFAAVLLASVPSSLRPPRQNAAATPDLLAGRLRLDGDEPGPAGSVPYHVRRVPLGFLLMLVAGTLSGLLGIGGGAAKVLAMDRAMSVPFKVSTTTSNFMIGVTAATSAGVYLAHGYVDPGLVMPVTLGVLAGSVTGARVLVHAATGWLRLVFAAVLIVLALEMLRNAFAGGL